jgi:hypothetical protein
MNELLPTQHSVKDLLRFPLFFFLFSLCLSYSFVVTILFHFDFQCIILLMYISYTIITYQFIRFFFFL